MIEKLIEKSISRPVPVITVLIFILIAGIYSWRTMATDVFPDASPVMVPIFSELPGTAPREVEELISFPIEQSMQGLPGVRQIKSTSAFGMSVVYVYFEDDMDIYFTRQLVARRLESVRGDLPAGMEEPTLGPIASGLGEVFMYYLSIDSTAYTDGKPPLTYLRELNDWVIKPRLRTVEGVTDVLSMGGNKLQYQIAVDPWKLQQYNCTMEDIRRAVTAHNRNVGGQYLQVNGEEHLLRGIGRIETPEDIREIPVKVRSGVAVTVSDVAQVSYGATLRRGVVTRNGAQEVVAGIVIKLHGENSSAVIARLEKAFEDLPEALPDGVEVVPYYNQQKLVDTATGTMSSALLLGSIGIILVLLLFLGDLRSALLVALALPVCALTAVILMRIFGISANLMSLGGLAVAIGLLADGSIVMVENIHRHLFSENKDKLSRRELISTAAGEVARPILFSLCIVCIVFLPLFSFQGMEGKMFRPMAITMICAVFGSLLVSLFAMPVLARLGLSRHESRPMHRLLLHLESLYRLLLVHIIRWKKAVALAALLLFSAACIVLPRLGREFIPVLEEGSITVSAAMAPSISLQEAQKAVTDLEKLLQTVPEVQSTIAKIGRPEAGSHPHPINSALIQLELSPRREWRFESKDELIAELNHTIGGYPGVQLSYSQPIQHTMDDLITGTKSQLAIKVFGENLDTLRTYAEEIRRAVADVPGIVDLATEQSYGQPQYRVELKKEAARRYGVTVDDLMDIVQHGAGGAVIDQVLTGTRRYPVHIRLDSAFRSDTAALAALPVQAPSGALLQLRDVATITAKQGPLQINREDGYRRWTVEANIRDRDLAGAVAQVQQEIAAETERPAGVFITYGGQFENQQRAMSRLLLIVPAALAGIFILLWMSFHSVKTALLIAAAIPLSLTGGVFGLWLHGEYLSVPASVGFIALFGIAVQDAMVLVSSIRTVSSRGVPRDEAVEEGSVLRLRPVLLTTFTTLLGLLPLLLSRGIGAEVQRPLAVVVVWGLISSTALTLIVKPALYSWLEKDDL
jgi:cobalt-zinc-cadmium resistance protein CzcA